MKNQILLVTLVTIIIFVSASTSANAHHHSECLPPYSQLFVFTQPVQKECLLLKNGNGVPVNASSGLPWGQTK
jgi:hypothetical protein